MQTVSQLITLLNDLRDKNCAWTQQQTLDTLAPQTLEECYELTDAIARKDISAIKSELGDLLYHVLFYAKICEEQGWFDLNDMAQVMIDKHLERMPSESELARMDAEQVNEIWQQKKQAQLQATESILGDVPTTMPASMQALKLQSRAAKVNFDWPSITGVLNKVDEELAETKDALKQGEKKHIEHEIGDLLFACINLARHANVDAELVLQQCNQRFRQRFNYIEQHCQAHNKTINKLSLTELEALWQQAKANGNTYE